jgi:acyl phosphate:glycerol-3-phosphate acyltransferase
MIYALAIIGGYLVGSIPFGLLLTKFAGYGDIRDIGSGNIGATNVLRTGNKKLALATLLLDATKGAIVVCIAHYFASFDIALIAGFAALVGHLFPVWLKFKGGKGVATTLGTLLALKPLLGLAACAIWLITALLTRYSSLSAIIAVLLAPFVAHFLYDNDYLDAFCGFVALLVIMKHRANIERLIRKEEPKIGQKK